MWPRSRILRSFCVLFSFFLGVQLLVYLLIPNDAKLDKLLIRGGEYAVVYDRPFVIPKCVKENEYAYSAVNRTASESCRRRIAAVACGRPGTHRATLSISCPLQKRLVDGPDYLGCFKDATGARDLDGSLVRLADSNRPEACIDVCRSQGMGLAGLQFGVECHCGRRKTRLYERLPETRCSITCPGDKKQTCGGFLAQRIFQTGVTGPIRRYTRLVHPDLYEQDIRPRVVFLLVVNGRGWRQVKRLFRLIYHVNHYYLIHVDKRCDYLHGMLQPLTTQFPNVRLTSWRMSTIWGGTSLLQMLLRAMGDLLRMEDWHWDYVINLSESDLPVKTNDYLTAYLTRNVGRSFLKSHGQNPQRFMVKQGMDRLFLECDEHLWLVGRRKVPRGIMLDGGSDWVALHRTFVKFVILSNDSLVTGLKDYFQYSLLPVESFFHTLAQNSRFCDLVIDNNLHFTNWDRSKGCHCQQRAVVDWCGCSPAVIRMEDLHKLEGMNGTERTHPRPLFFARKFDPVVDQLVINHMEEGLYGKPANDETSLLSYWQSLYHPRLDSGPGADLSRSFLAGLAAVAAAELDPLSDHCGAVQFDWREPGEGHVLFVHGVFEGVLARVRLSGVWAELLFARTEPVVKRRQDLPMKTAVDVSARLRSLKIGSSYDPKENIFRNYAGVLGPNSTVTVLHEWAVGKEMKVHFLWLDPGSRPAVLLRVTIPGGIPHRSHFNLDVDYGPLRAGRWRVKVLDEAGVFVAELGFLVLPQLFARGVLLAATDAARALNCGPPLRRYSDTQVDASVARLDTEQERRSDHACALAEEDLGRHAARLLTVEWSVREWCVSASLSAAASLEEFRRGCRRYEACEEAGWSSLSPDPKAELRPVDGRTGRLMGA